MRGRGQHALWANAANRKFARGSFVAVLENQRQLILGPTGRKPQETYRTARTTDPLTNLERAVLVRTSAY
jgi:hypothetical protein